MKYQIYAIAVCAALACVAGNASGQQNPPPRCVYSFSADQTIADIGKWNGHRLNWMGCQRA
jgi:hypothetical protein